MSLFPVKYAAPILDNDLNIIENMIQESLLLAFKQLYQFANGENNDNNTGLFFGGEFINAEKIIETLDFSLSLLKPKQRTITDPQKSQKLLDDIVNFYIRKINEDKSFQSKKLLWFKPEPAWFKIEFSCSPNSYEGPYVYRKPDTIERDILRIDDYSKVSDIIAELYQLEAQTYNWDKLNFTLYQDLHYTVERIDFNFDENISFTSIPEQTIKNKYFYYKWLPIFSDYAGNYICIDLDPDTNGTKGQIINFGRDEEDMTVLGKNLEDFFDFVLQMLDKNQSEILADLKETHFIDLIKKWRLANPLI